MNFDVEKRQDDGQEQPAQIAAAVVQQRGPFELDVQRTATGKPRDVQKAIAEAIALVSDPAIAATMSYRLERNNRSTGEKTYIEGPSVRMAEIVAYSWRNIASAGNIIEIGERTITAEGIAVDLERNNPVRVTVTRSIVGRDGRRYRDESLIAQIAGAAQAIAMRNAIFKVIPGAYVRKILESAKAAAKGGDVVGLRAQMLKYWRGQNVTDEEVFRMLGRESVEQITIEDVVRLRGTAEAIRDGETTVDAEFREAWREQKAEAAEKVTRLEPVKQRTVPPSNQTTADGATFIPASEHNSAINTPDGVPLEVQHAIAGGIRKNIVAQAEKENPPVLDIDYAATTKDMLGAKLYARVWPTLKAAASDEEGVLDGSFVIRVIAAPKTIIEACLSDGDPIAALRQVAAAGTQKKLV